MTNINIEQFYKSFPTLSHKRNRFPFEKEINFNMKMGEITPITAIRVVPGQTYNLDLSTVIKVAPLQVPPMDNAYYKAFAFYNPDRNTWKNYKYWFGEKQNPENPEEEPTYLVPKVTAPEGGFIANGFYDNIGCPTQVPNYKIDAFIPRTDRMIYNNYFRNQTLENPLTINYGDEDDTAADNEALRLICKPRDLYTQCLPTQSGTTPVEIPLGSSAPIVWNSTTEDTNVTLPNGAEGKKAMFYKGANNATLYATDEETPIVFTTSGQGGTLSAELSNAMGAPLEGLYQAIAYNTYQYLTSRGGNRYWEHVSNVYGVVNPEGIMHIPEYLGSTSAMIDFDTVTQTSSTSGEATPLASRAANGYMENYGNIINKSFGEFGWIIIYGVITYFPKYQQGVSKLMQTNDPLELFNPLFNLMGDEAIYNSDIYVQSDEVVDENGNPVNDGVFGYGKRNSRLLYPVNEIHGEQRSNYAQSLDMNHFAQDFEELPVLNKEFDKVTDEGFKRCLMVQDETQFVCNAVITGTNDIEIPLQAIPSPNPQINFQSI